MKIAIINTQEIEKLDDKLNLLITNNSVIFKERCCY